MATCEIPRSKSYDKNIDHYGENEKTCVVCGKPTKMQHYIHATTSWEATTDGDEIPNSQGLFPVGPDCKKLFDPKFIFNI